MKTAILGLSVFIFCSVAGAQDVNSKQSDCNKHCQPIDLMRGADTAPFKVNHVHDDLSLGKQISDLSLNKIRDDLSRGKDTNGLQTNHRMMILIVVKTQIF